MLSKEEAGNVNATLDVDVQNLCTPDPLFAIVIPIYKHSVLLIEALECALAEAKTSNGAVVLVNDGCPFLETHEYCLDFARALPGLVSYVRTPNGGLSAARNRGIRLALSNYPSAKAIYLLDADNRLTEGALQRALDVMTQTDADWVYPSIEKFGLEWSGDYSPAYLILRHLKENISEAGSLVQTRVFRAGIWFDENMKRGFEDWDFWLQCIAKGLRGAPAAEMGFQYRSRRESMLRNSDRERSELVGFLQRKHQALYHSDNILQLEHHEAPRYCIVNYMTGQYSFTSAPENDSLSRSLFHFDEAFWRADFYPETYHFPNFVVAVHGSVMSELKSLKLLDWIFWHIEDALENSNIVAIILDPSDWDLSVQTINYPEAGELPKAIHIVAASRSLVRDCALNPDTQWLDSIRTVKPEPKLSVARISAPIKTIAVQGVGAASSVTAFFDVIARLRASLYVGTKAKWAWRQANLEPSAEIFRFCREVTHGFAPLARSSLAKHNELAIVLPILSFGGVEQVALQVAAKFKLAGWKIRLIITQSLDIAEVNRATGLFDCVCFLDDPAHACWNPAGAKYFGHDLQRWAVDGRRDRLIGLLAGCSAVINFHAMQVNEVTGWLQRQGVITATSMHLIDRDTLGGPVGHPYMLLPYEHAYDFVTAPSKQLLSLMSGLGVPSEKLMLLRNYPTFVLNDGEKAARLAELQGARGNRPLRVLYFGRLDRQKGIERVQAVVNGARNQLLPIEWRVIGSSVIASEENGAIVLPGLTVEKPVYRREEVKQRLLWADVILLLSHWEGAPLIILEAQSTGTITIATDVGAVSELIETGTDGFIVANGSLAEVVVGTLQILADLIASPERRTSVAEGAMKRIEMLDRHDTGDNLVEAFERSLSARQHRR